MEDTGRNSNSFRDLDESSLALLRRRYPELHALAHAKKGANGSCGSGDCVEFSCGLDGAAALFPLGASENGAARTNGDGATDSNGECATAPALDMVERLVQKANAISIKKRRRDGLSPLAAATSPPISFAAPASSVAEDGISSTATAAIGRSRSSRGGGRNVGMQLDSPRRLLLEALTNSAKADEQSIRDELAPSFADGVTLVQLLQQCRGGLCVSLGHSEDCADEQNGAASSPSTVTNSSSLDNSVALSLGGMSGREFRAQLSAAVALMTSESIKGGDGETSAAMLHLHSILENASQFEHSRDAIQVLKYMDKKERYLDDDGADGDANNKNLYEDDSGGEAEGQEAERGPYYEEDMEDFNKTIDKMGRLTLSTMRDLAELWTIHLDEAETDRVCRMKITERLRLLAVTIVDVVSDRLNPHAPLSSSPGVSQRQNSNDSSARHKQQQQQQQGRSGQVDTDAAVATQQLAPAAGERVRALVLSLRHEICLLSPEHLERLASMLGFIDCSCSPEEIFITISALGVLTFFSPLPTPLLEKVCHELGIPTKDESTESADANQLPELLAERISHYFYPLRHTVPFITKVPFMPQMKIHEHAPGRYTCTIDNAKLMKELALQRLVSNRFSCKKVRWYALLAVKNDELSFYVWHRHSSSLRAHMVVRTQDPKKRRKNNGAIGDNNNGNADASPSQESTLRESSALFIEREGEAAPGELIGFDNFVPLTMALRSSTMSQSGYRLYNRTEDRLVFQYVMQLMHPDGTPLEDGKKKSESNHTSSKNTCTRRGCDHSAERCGCDQQVALVTAAERAKRLKEWEKLTSKLERNETQERESVEQAWNSVYRQLMNEYGKALQKAAQRKKDRERKTLLAKVGPSPELHRELDMLTQTVTTNRAHVNKLTKDKTKEEEAIHRFKEQIEEGNRELERLRQLLKSHGEVLSGLESDTTACIARTRERQEARWLKQRELAAALHIPELSTTRHETLAINDLDSFWAPSSTNGAVSRLFAAATSPTQSSAHCTPQSLVGASATTAPTSSSTGAAAAGGGGPLIPLPRSAVVGGAGAFSPPLGPTATGAAVSTSGALGVALSTWGPLAEPLPFTTAVRGSSTGGIFDSPSATFSQQPPLPQLDAVPLGVADVVNSTGTAPSAGFTVTAPFTTASAVTRFTLDANARPFTPTSMVTAQTGSSTASHSNFTVVAGGATVSQRSPTLTSPMAGISASSPVLAGGGFPEKPRYTSVSTTVPGGLFSTDPLQAAAPLFAPPGLQSGSGALAQENCGGLSLNFTTAPWN
ncbi:hypothetical protein DQ04_02661000 [Trypanosoma grayi]|uniref:hypothetical protein n=1 Tax=Trypanosoma grayi TaxID=71804 RepID=UPI0004F4BA37|nr:hypothetical protein DQ04_02661000 [Trypanosoma grayi]KEG11395.1 hypothetical protein DQ04_02661000 [Trypanosoma grayi]